MIMGCVRWQIEALAKKSKEVLLKQAAIIIFYCICFIKLEPI